MVVSRLLLVVAALAGGAVAHLLEDTIRSNLQEIADVEAKKYDCVVNIAVRGDDGLTVAVSADGESQRGLVDGTPATPLSNFAWGSVTKMVTGVTIIRLANEGHFDLDDTVAPILDRCDCSSHDQKRVARCVKWPSAWVEMNGTLLLTVPG